ncbi:GyrI-like domain-containing protein [bacterium]|nr:GyrI-like domain-containing protein [bacterium]
MQKKLKIGLSVIGAIVVILLLYMSYLGMFRSVKVVEQATGPYTYVYQEFTGDYKLTGPIFGNIYQELKKAGIETSLGFGVYYDDPQTKPAEELRSDCGIVIAPEDAAKAAMITKNFKIGKLEVATRAVVVFPIKNKSSYMIGPMKAYPALIKYAKEMNYEEMVVGYELYDHANKKTVYMMDLVKKENL